jgi:acyl carrier protein
MSSSLGRLDDQVKVRGFRIEMGEVEVALRECAGVRAGVVVARQDVPREPRLVAYVVAEGEKPTIGELRKQMGERLPEYMLPTGWVFLEELPMTPSGKVDRRNLPMPEGRPEVGTEYIAPRSETETRLAGICEELLGVERVGVEDNFFELGGHSLLGTQLISRVRDVWQVELPLRALFESPTVAALAARIDELAASNTQPVHMPGIVAVSRQAHRTTRSSLKK